MILWLVCLATLALAAWTDARTRSLPAWLPVVPVGAAAIVSPSIASPGDLPVVLVALWNSLIALTLALCVLNLARVGWGDMALALPLALVLGIWVVVVLAVSLTTGLILLTRRRRPDDPFVPHLLAGFLLASGLRWAVGG